MNIENTVESVGKLTNFEIAYGLALALNSRYSSGGHSVGRSERSFLLDFFFRLNNQRLSSVSSLDPFVNQRIFLEEGMRRLSLQILENENKVSEFQDTKENFSVIVLYLWIIHYRIKMVELKAFDSHKDEVGGHVSLNDIDFSFSREIESAEVIYKLCLVEVAVPEGLICNEALKYLHSKLDEDNNMPRQTYEIDLSWRVDDLCAL